MIYKILTNYEIFEFFVNKSLSFLSIISFEENYDVVVKSDDDVVVVKNYFEDQKTYDFFEKISKKQSLYITYLPRSSNHKESYAFVTKSFDVYNKLDQYIKLYKKKTILIYDFPNYWDIQWKATIMCERMCAKMMNDVCVKLFDGLVIPYDFITDMNWNIRMENIELLKKIINYADKIICSVAITRLLKKINIEIDPEKIILHPHVWGTNISYSMNEVENDFGYRVPYKNMCYMSNVQEINKKENSFLGFYVNEIDVLSEKNNDILLWGKDINFVFGKERVDEKIKLIDTLCEKYTVYTTVNNDCEFNRIKDSMVNKHNFINYGILNRNDYLDNMKSFKIFLSLNENVYESLGFIESLSAGCHIVSHDKFHRSITHCDDADIKKCYSIYKDISEIIQIVDHVIVENIYASKILDVYTKHKYVNRVINIINGEHETNGTLYF